MELGRWGCAGSRGLFPVLFHAGCQAIQGVRGNVGRVGEVGVVSCSDSGGVHDMSVVWGCGSGGGRGW